MKTTLDTEHEDNVIPWQKLVADILTVTRAPMGVALVWLGIAQGKGAIQSAFILLLVAATIDTLDGYFARLSQYPFQTWVGARDLAFDLSFSAALLLYLSLAGYVSVTLAAVYVAIWVWLFRRRARDASTLAVLFQAPLYGAVGLAAILHNPSIVGWTAVWLVVMLAFAGQRFFHVRLPAFVETLLEKAPAAGRCFVPRGLRRQRPGARHGQRNRD